MLPIMYSFRRCPYAIRARYTLALLDVSVELREVVLRSKPQALLSLGGRSSVPQLIDVKGARYPESLDIIFWALSNSNKPKMSCALWPQSMVQKSKVIAWIKYNDHFFKYWLDRYKYADRFPEFSEEYYRNKGEVFLKRLNKRLEENDFLFGNEICLADVAVFPFVRQFAAVRPDWFEQSEYSHVKTWLNGFLNSHLFSAIVMKKMPAWEAGQEVVLFPAY
ncbi:glutathione S-transferase [Marinomonas ushuaiensis DSM 15871]|uniref:Glutathione S-transferase n=1 Tax=Marinomonas ushuaiensis DSM 15871 TaxID=1122207 RepID=X7E0M4_9GAMM|nr:glutathione S-transferase [Marinomonas ushuaiensis]ETX09502.1 glutathione S-transferase [Marinomonas ushuaiensis DSM 15871]